jgi:hypothetical protein
MLTSEPWRSVTRSRNTLLNAVPQPAARALASGEVIGTTCRLLLVQYDFPGSLQVIHQDELGFDDSSGLLWICIVTIESQSWELGFGSWFFPRLAGATRVDPTLSNSGQDRRQISGGWHGPGGRCVCIYRKPPRTRSSPPHGYLPLTPQ